MTREQMTCREAAAAVRRLRDLARSVAMPPGADAELRRIEGEVGAAAQAVLERLADVQRDERQATLF
jgi:hypothetical protein